MYRVEIMFKGAWAPSYRKLTAAEAECYRGYCELHGDVARVVPEAS